ncbi:FliM/FliN family flagellar motor switch protein [Myxococcota bacterium]
MAQRPVAEAGPYPWGALDLLGRSAVQRARRARCRVERTQDLQRLAAVVAEILGTEVRLAVQRIGAEKDPDGLPAARVELQLSEESGRVVVGLEPALAALAIGQVLRLPPQIESPGRDLDPLLHGALAAVVLEVARRTSDGAAPRLLVAEPQALKDGVKVEATVWVAGRAYQAAAWCECALDADPDDQACRLDSWPGLRVSLPVVAGLCVAGRSELFSLRLADVWSCGAGWLLDSRGIGQAALAAPGDDFGIALECAEGGKIVLRGERVSLPVDVEEQEGMSGANGTLGEAVLDAPLVVRVEVGAISMLVRDWLRLRPGDVIQTNHRIAQPVVLRVAGEEVGRGELVNVEGELGVRIRELTKGEASP